MILFLIGEVIIGILAQHTHLQSSLTISALHYTPPGTLYLLFTLSVIKPTLFPTLFICYNSSDSIPDLEGPFSKASQGLLKSLCKLMQLAFSDHINHNNNGKDE